MSNLDQIPEQAPEKVSVKWAVKWAVWVLVGLFLEFWALRRKGHGDTLSSQVWAIQDRLQREGKKGKVARWVFAGGLLAFLGWLIPHWVLGIV